MGGVFSRIGRLDHKPAENSHQKCSLEVSPKISTPFWRSRTDIRKFTPFPKLPAEIRIQIWKYLLPNGPANDGKRIFRLRVEIDESKTAKFAVALPWTSTYTYKDDGAAQKAEEQRMEYEYGEDMKNIGLLGACKESRAVYFEKSKSWNSLPAIRGGTIYFEDSTTIYIDGLIGLLLHPITATPEFYDFF